MKRRTVIKALALTPALPIIASCDSGSSGTALDSAGAYSLVFSPDDYKVMTTTVTGTGRGTKTVKYHFYEARPYVRHPVDTTYQSLTVSVPVEIDGKAVDASNAPICLDINVGGYTSSAVGGEGGSAAAPGGTKPGGTKPGGTGSAPSGSAPGAGQYGQGSTKGGGAAAGAGAAAGQVDNGQLFLAAGWVMVSPGCRGRDNEKDGRYFGKAPAAVVDLKSAVRYIRYNKGRLPGNPDWIVTTGGSAGGALSTVVAASGDSPLYDEYLTALGAADVSDAVYASASYSPITDLDHADMAYEWMWGKSKLNGALVNQTYSTQLKDNFTGYMRSLDISGLTASNYADYLISEYLEPSATKYLAALTAEKRATYLADNTWITWEDAKATFSWQRFLDHCGGRLKSVPAFDGFECQNAENIEFGDANTNARHFTLYSLRHQTGSPAAQLASDLPAKIEMMNPMYFLLNANPKRARNWWIRTGTLDNNTSHTVVGNLAALTTKLGDNVNSSLYWDGGHAVNEDAPEFIDWVSGVTGHPIA